ncbi:lamin tail domain-containing protein [Dyadobacter sp. NIV53]|uniref:lamin tail domain-containing protein n=1 Tax=Dyadobacter sp. NIV53 TaxID=2861765 RepID=UPI001C87AE0A|nr:lamin tail domain-containing protein [Dyadobacter sp. NIV53]
MIPPLVTRVDILGNKELVVVFNERMDSVNAVLGSVITLSGRNIIKRQLALPVFHNLILTLDSPLLEGREYVLNIRNISDCAGNLLRESNHILALPSQADSGDIVINEILFNPREGGVDFVELNNKSRKYISLNNWALGNTKNGEPNVFSIITTDQVIMPPNSYLALTTEPSVVKEQYPVDRPQNFLEMASFPAYSNVGGGVILRDNNLRLSDKFIYSEEMHHELLSDVKGVSLEKTDAEKTSADLSNWHSAAATVGYATPGYANSQMLTDMPEDVFTVEPEAFTPDNDGLDDYTIIRYSQSVTGRIAALRIYNISGRLIRNMIDNQLIGTTGEIRWDGTDDHGQLVPTGYYLLLVDTFDTTGNKQQFKKRVIVARKGK